VVWQIRQYATHVLFNGEYLDIQADVPAFSYNRSLFSLTQGVMSYSGDGVTVLQGVDVSSHQGTIDWPAVAKDGIQFAMIRVGGRYYGVDNGTVFEDNFARVNLQGALDAGLEVGVYFFSQAITVAEAQEEAQMVLDMLADYPITGPVVYDWETISATARTDGLDTATLTAQANAFCAMIAEAGYQPMIYFNQRIGYLHYDLSQLLQYPFWLAEYNAAPGFYYDFQMLQYSDTGSVAGISTRVDRDLWLRRA
jgi:GH25 family lysozyme M1 (1,4-beta-N-acetylmuramidase)